MIKKSFILFFFFINLFYIYPCSGCSNVLQDINFDVTDDKLILLNTKTNKKIILFDMEEELFNKLGVKQLFGSKKSLSYNDEIFLSFDFGYADYIMVSSNTWKLKKGIQIGMNKQKVIKILGTNYRIKDDVITYVYYNGYLGTTTYSIGLYFDSNDKLIKFYVAEGDR